MTINMQYMKIFEFENFDLDEMVKVANKKDSNIIE